MKDDEFAFFNQQLAAMLRDGIPLEGALHRLCTDMGESALKTELQSLAASLTKGIPLRDAVRATRLPELYRRLIEVGTESNDLPGVLTMLADHYQRRHDLWTRLKGLMMYPMIVLCSAFLLSCFLAYLFGAFVWPSLESITQRYSTSWIRTFLWFSPVFFGFLVLIALIVLAVPMVRRAMRWRVPAFRESSVAQVASAMSLMLRSGVTLDQSLALVERLEQNTCAGPELVAWRQRLASGCGKFADLATPGRAFPPLFIWLVARGGDDLAAGFQKAADIYQSRAKHRADMILYSALPVSILALGLMLISQVQPVFHTLVKFMNMIGDVGGD